MIQANNSTIEQENKQINTKAVLLEIPTQLNLKIEDIKPYVTNDEAVEILNNAFHAYLADHENTRFNFDTICVWAYLQNALKKNSISKIQSRE